MECDWVKAFEQWGDLDQEQLLDLYLDAEAHYKEVQLWRDELKNALLTSMVDNKEKVLHSNAHNLWVERKAKSGSHKWDDDQLLGLLSVQSVDSSTGERQNAVPIRDLQECAKISYWRVGPLKNRDIDPNQYRDLDWKGWNTKVSDVDPELGNG